MQPVAETECRFKVLPCEFEKGPPGRTAAAGSLHEPLVAINREDLDLAALRARGADLGLAAEVAGLLGS